MPVLGRAEVPAHCTHFDENAKHYRTRKIAQKPVSYVPTNGVDPSFS